MSALPSQCLFFFSRARMVVRSSMPQQSALLVPNPDGREGKKAEHIMCDPGRKEEEADGGWQRGNVRKCRRKKMEET